MGSSPPEDGLRYNDRQKNRHQKRHIARSPCGWL
jgi:hypothetical protein